MKRKAQIFFIAMLVTTSAAIYGYNSSTNKDGIVREKLQKIDCIINEKASSPILHIKADDQEFCNSSNFRFYGEKLDQDNQKSNTNTVAVYREDLKKLLGKDVEVSRDNVLHKELLVILISFYNSPYKKLTVSFKENNQEYSRSIEK